MSFKLIDHSDKVKAAMEQQIETALEAIGLHIEGEAKEELQNSPKRVDTGLLRNSITHAVSGQAPAISSYHASMGSNRIKKGKNAGKRRSAKAKNAGAVGYGTYSGIAPDDKDKCVYIGTNVEYAIYVHEGTSKMTPNRFLKNAATRNASQIKKYFEQALKG